MYFVNRTHFVFWEINGMVNVPLESQRCAILCVSHNHAVQGNLDVGALNRALTENQSFMKVKAAIFYYFHGFSLHIN